MAVYLFGPFRLDPAEHLLTRGSEPIVLTPKVFETLVLLVEARGKLVDRETFMTRLWPDTVVEERNLTVNMSTLRKALSPDGSEEFVETVPRVGYRLIPAVIDEVPAARPEVAAQAAPAAVLSPQAPRRRPLWWTGVAVATALITIALVSSLRTGPAADADAVVDPRDPARPVIAVLPFVVTGGPDAEAFGLGLADTVIGRLESAPRMMVRRTREISNVKGESALAIGRALNAAYVVEGVVQRADHRAKVRMSIIDVATGSTTWTDEFEQRESELFRLQDVLAANVSGSVMRRVSIEQIWSRYPKRPRTDDAFQAYLNARMVSSKTQAGVSPLDAVHAFERAVAVDPTFSPAWSGLARMHRMWSFEKGADHDAEWKAAYDALDRAIALDPTWSEGHQVLGMLKYSEWDWKGAEQHMRKAVEVDPDNVDAVTWLGNLLRGLARWDECRAIYKRALEIDPSNSVATQQLGEMLWHEGQTAESLGLLMEASRLQPGNSAPHQIRAELYDTIGNGREAIEARRIAAEIAGDQEYLDRVVSVAPRGYTAVLEADLALRKERRDHWRTAALLAQLGRKDEALDALEACVGERCFMSALIATEPRLSTLRSSSRYRELVRKVNLAHLLL